MSIQVLSLSLSVPLADSDSGCILQVTECALCLALQESDLPKGGGMLTPASGLGTTAIARLRAAGMTITAEREGASERGGVGDAKM